MILPLLLDGCVRSGYGSQLVQSAADVKWLGAQGVDEQRHILGQEPGTLMSNALVADVLARFPHESKAFACLSP